MFFQRLNNAQKVKTMYERNRSQISAENLKVMEIIKPDSQYFNRFFFSSICHHKIGAQLYWAALSRRLIVENEKNDLHKNQYVLHKSHR